MISRNVKQLAIAFMFIFFGYNAVQQYVTVFFSEYGNVNAGFITLILIYGFFMVGNLISPLVVNRLGSRISMILGGATYAVFILSLQFGTFYVYPAAILIGIGAGILWTGQNNYLISNSKKEVYGASSGLFTTTMALGMALGSSIIGALSYLFALQNLFLLFAAGPLIGIIIIMFMKKGKPDNIPNPIKYIKRSLMSITVIRLSVIGFAFSFAQGLVMGIMPIKIAEIMGIQYVGILAMLFFIGPVSLSYVTGWLSDKLGRKKLLIYSFIPLLLGLILAYFAKTGFALVASIILLTINRGALMPLRFALIGDISNHQNINNVTAVFNMMNTLAVTLALLISMVVISDMIYIYSSIIVLLSLFIIAPVFALPMEKIKARLSSEV